MDWTGGVRVTEMLRTAPSFWPEQWEERSCRLLRWGILEEFGVFY